MTMKAHLATLLGQVSDLHHTYDAIAGEMVNPGLAIAIAGLSEQHAQHAQEIAVHLSEDGHLTDHTGPSQFHAPLAGLRDAVSEGEVDPLPALCALEAQMLASYQQVAADSVPADPATALIDRHCLALETSLQQLATLNPSV